MIDTLWNFMKKENDVKNIAIKNYRSIEDSGTLEILPITVVVGKNSAGKSSFLRIFPLLKQTLERKISDSILWYGDYVDLGDFKHAVSKKQKDKPIEFSFSLNISSNDLKYRYLKQNLNTDYIANINICIREKYFEKIIITIEDQVIEINMDSDGVAKIIINDDESVCENLTLRWFRSTGELLPELIEEHNYNGNENKLYFRSFDGDVFVNKYRKLIYKNKYTSSNDYEFSFSYGRNDILLGSKEQILNILKTKNKEKFNNYKILHKRFLKINNYIIASKISNIIYNINQSITQDMKSTSYVKPIRAMVDRYYRVQGISIDELDADGSNLPMILYNMSKPSLRKFESWCKEKFGVIFSVTDAIGHVSLIVKDSIDSKDETNVADTGYGYSQMLPIVVLLWMIHNNQLRGNEKISKTIVIEQPELHLHPAYQAKMIDVFVNVIKEALDKGIDLKILFETHSETMINRLGILIAEKKLDEKLVNIIVFDKEKDNDYTKIFSKKFNENGLLKGWPIGFFAADEVL